MTHAASETGPPDQTSSARHVVETSIGRALVEGTDGPLVSGEQDALDLLPQVWEVEAAWLVLPVSRLAPSFFQLRSGVAGAIAGKLVTYRVGLVVLGDVSAHEAASSAFADLVRESSPARQLWFVPDLETMVGGSGEGAGNG